MSQFDIKAKSALYWAPQIVIASLICGLATTLCLNSAISYDTLDFGETLFKTTNLLVILLMLGVIFILSSLLGIVRYYLINKTDDFKRDFFALLILGIICIAVFGFGINNLPANNMPHLNIQNVDTFYTNIKLCISIITLVILVPTTVSCIIYDINNKKKNLPYTNTSRIIKVMLILIATVLLTILLIIYSASLVAPFIINNIIR